MSRDQQNEIREAVKKAASSEPIWFVYARLNRDGDYSTAVYFRPISINSRVQRGGVVSVGRSRFTDEIARAMNQTPSTKPSASGLTEYVFVQHHDKNAISPDPPAGNEMPFEVEGDFTDNQLEELVDFYRSANRKRISPKPVNNVKDGLSNITILPEIITRLPILKIRQSGQNVEIMTGTVEAFLSGAGQTLLLKWEPAGLELVQLSEWVS